MTAGTLAAMPMDDPQWPRASAWLVGDGPATAEFRLVGVPTSTASISPSEGWRTPSAFRRVLQRFPTFDGETYADLTVLTASDLGDWQLAGLDPASAHREIERLAASLGDAPVHAFVGGDNSITRPLLRGLARGDLSRWGLLTLDAHHDVRVLDFGATNGTPVRGLVEDGLPADHVAQVGINAFANSRAYRTWCDERGIGIWTIGDVDRQGITAVVDTALGTLRKRCDAIYVDVDLDVLDRAFAPACPGARPGGLTPGQLAAAVRRCGADPAVVAVDFVEVDPTRDVADMTLEALAVCVLAFASGVAGRGVARG